MAHKNNIENFFSEFESQLELNNMTVSVVSRYTRLLVIIFVKKLTVK